jgi:CheY-like chemotaxis protein
MIENLDFNLREVIHDAAVAMSFTATSKGLDFQVSVDDQIPSGVTGDPFRLNQILLNLLGNAIKFTEKGFVRLSVQLVKEEANLVNVRFAIRDSGIGIPAEQHEKIFESFNQANIGHTRKYGGTGLGLTITRQLIELQGGKLRLESEPGKGSEFSFSLSYKLSSTELTGQSEHDIASGKGLTGLKALIVEDNLTNQFVAGQVLQRWKVDFAFADNGKIALDKLREAEFDLVLMDLQMPEMDGYEATLQIRSGKSGFRI